VEQYANSLIRKDHKLAKPIASSRDNSEQVRALKELQRNLAERIRKIQRGAQYRQPGENA